MRNAQEIAEIIRELLRERNIKINKMLIDAGLKKDIIGQMERGSMPSADKLGKIATYLEVSTDYLLGLDDKKRST